MKDGSLDLDLERSRVLLSPARRFRRPSRLRLRLLLLRLPRLSDWRRLGGDERSLEWVLPPRWRLPRLRLRLSRPRSRLSRHLLLLGGRWGAGLAAALALGP